MTETATEDFSVQDCGSVCLFTVLSSGCLNWIRENVQIEGWQWMGSCSFAVESRYAEQIEQILLGEGWVNA